jgi:putative FmdB family regulatory protein
VPIFEYRCPSRHVIEALRKFEHRDEPQTCHCGQPMLRIFSAHHQAPDGIYSYEPNIGSADAFDRKMAEQGK